MVLADAVAGVSADAEPSPVRVGEQERRTGPQHKVEERNSVGLVVACDHSDQPAPFIAVEVDRADLDVDIDEGCVEREVDFVFDACANDE